MNEQPVEKNFNAFAPLLILAVSFFVILAWNFTQALQQYSGASRLETQQEVLVMQAAQSESKVKAMMEDLIALSKTDEDAAAIVKKFQIKINAPNAPQPAPASAPVPAAPAAKPAGSASKTNK
jgi:hypothetical protein